MVAVTRACSPPGASRQAGARAWQSGRDGLPAGRGAAQPAAVFQPLELGADVLALASGHVDAGPLPTIAQVTGPPVSAATAATASSSDR